MRLKKIDESKYIFNRENEAIGEKFDAVVIEFKEGKLISKKIEI